METLSLQNIENCYDQIFKGAKQTEKDETEAIKTTPPSQYVTTAYLSFFLFCIKHLSYDLLQTNA
jgi:hypothetical protein